MGLLLDLRACAGLIAARGLGKKPEYDA